MMKFFTLFRGLSSVFALLSAAAFVRAHRTL